MKNTDQQDMQVKTVHKWQKALDNSTKTVRFLWRHAFVLAAFGLLVTAFLRYPSIDWSTFFIELVIAFVLDRFKNSLRPGQGPQLFDRKFGIKDEDWIRSPSQIGSASWNMNPSIPGTSAYYAKQNTSRYN